MQAYLNSALVTWWTHKHSMTSWTKSSNMGEWIRMRVDHINLILCKVPPPLPPPLRNKLCFFHQRPPSLEQAAALPTLQSNMDFV